jgi:hypothetical protein
MHGGLLMDGNLHDLYGKFDTYLVRLDADVQEAVAELPEKLAKGFRISRPSLAEFQQIWSRICENETLRARWLNRLAPGGYEAEEEAIRAMIHGAVVGAPNKPVQVETIKSKAA